MFHNINISCLLNRFLRKKQINYMWKIFRKNGLGLEGISFSLFFMLLVSFVCLFVVLVSFFLLSFTFLKFLRRHVVIFILKFILRTSVLCSLYVYIENKIKIIIKKSYTLQSENPNNYEKLMKKIRKLNSNIDPLNFDDCDSKSHEAMFNFTCHNSKPPWSHLVITFIIGT